MIVTVKYNDEDKKERERMFINQPAQAKSFIDEIVNEGTEGENLYP